MNETPAPTSAFCYNCGSSLRPGARFCPSCGARTQPAEATTTDDSQGDASLFREAFSGEKERRADESESMPQQPKEQVEEDLAPTGYSILLDSIPPQARGRTILALRQALNLSQQDAAMYIASAPLLLATGLPPEMAEMLRAALTNAGAVVTIKEPPVRDAPKRTTPAPEPHRRLASQDKTVQMKRIQVKTGVSTVTGLDLGTTNGYLAFARADGNRLAAAPEMVNFDSQAAIPAVIRWEGEDKPIAIGLEALKIWVQTPSLVRFEMLDQVGEDDAVLPILRAFFEVLAGRVSRVLMPGALAIAEGANTKLAVPADWDIGRRERLVEMATQAGFPVSRVVPAPVAIVAHHRQQGTLRQEDRQEKTMVIDWGGNSLAISFVEHGEGLDRPNVFEHIERPLGGNWFDQIIVAALEQQLFRPLDETDQRAFLLFARRFKEQMSNAFMEGKNVYAQYCAVQSGAQPARVQLSRSEFEAIASEGLALFQQSITGVVEAVGLQPEHLDHVILAGGGGRWYFAREAIRSALRQIPLIGANPEEACSRGLAVYNLVQ